MMRISFVVLSLALMAACTHLPDKEYRSPGQPESLISKSSERVSFSLKTAKFDSELSNWLDKDQPTRAQLGCTATEASCRKAEKILRSYGVAIERNAAAKKDTVVLLYDRIVARTCDNGYISNHHNYRNLNHPAFGCSVASNSLRMVTNQQDFVKPALSGLPDGQKAAQAITRAQGAPKEQSRRHFHFN
jgi:hypothetical protein